MRSNLPIVNLPNLDIWKKANCLRFIMNLPCFLNSAFIINMRLYEAGRVCKVYLFSLVCLWIFSTWPAFWVASSNEVMIKPNRASSIPLDSGTIYPTMEIFLCKQHKLHILCGNCNCKIWSLLQKGNLWWIYGIHKKQSHIWLARSSHSRSSVTSRWFQKVTHY